MKHTTTTAAIAGALFVAACAGGGSGERSPSDLMGRNYNPPNAANNEYRIHPGLAASDAKRSPIYRTGSLLRVGVDQGAGPEKLPTTEVPGFSNIQLRYGTIRDGAGVSELQSYLSSVQRQYSGLDRRLPGYEVRVIGSSSATERRRLLAAVQLVNATLPESAKLSVGAPLPGFSLKDTVNSNGRYFGSGRELANTIHVEFIPEAEFYSDAAATSWGEYILMSRGAFPAYTDERKAVILMAHELIHSLGIGGHVPERFDSIMEAGSQVYDRAQGSRQPASLLYPIDREAVRALYGPLLNSNDPEQLGPWARASEHFFVSNEHGAFGVALRNGYAEPWAYGLAPRTTLARSGLTGSATWSGALVGWTPGRMAVTGDAKVSVDIGPLTGRADFTGLEQWGSTPGVAGTGVQFGDGDLGYTIRVNGNTFRETGGDTGRVTGIFVGRSHEGAAGTLERSDLTAAFGAKR